MRVSLLTSAGVVIAGLLNLATARCGTREPTKGEYDTFTTRFPSVYFHIVLAAEDPRVGRQMGIQSAVLKDIFPFFTLAGVNKIINPALAAWPDSFCALPSEGAVGTNDVWNDACHASLETVPGRTRNLLGRRTRARQRCTWPATGSACCIPSKTAASP
ncbi:hypothetical protein VTI74DRAFT_1245 [Chaetomium olivicolor]